MKRISISQPRVLTAMKVICMLIIGCSAFFVSAGAFAGNHDFEVVAVEDDTYGQKGITPMNKYNTFEQKIGTWSGFKFSSYWRWNLTTGSVPKNGIITKAYITLTGCFGSAGPIMATFQGLVPDGKWEVAGGFNGSHYTTGAALDSIARAGTPINYYIKDDWTWGTEYQSPDISNLVQQFVNSDGYDPNDPAKRFFGLRCYFVDSYGSSSAYRQAYQEPDGGSLSAILHVEWDDEPQSNPSDQNPLYLDNPLYPDPIKQIFTIADIYDDTFLIWTVSEHNGNYPDEYWYYNTANCTQYSNIPINGRMDLNCARWRWILSSVLEGSVGATAVYTIPRGAEIYSAELTVTRWEEQPPYPPGSFPPSGRYVDLGVSHLAPDGIWDNKDGEGFADYGMCMLPNAIPGWGQVLGEIDTYVSQGTEYILPHDLSSLAQNFVNSTWNDEYDWYGTLTDRHYDYKAGDYFALGCGTGGWMYNVSQGLTTLTVDWMPGDYYSATYYMKDAPQEDTYSDGVNNNYDSEPPLDNLVVGGGNKGYWRFGLTVPQYAVIQKATLVYTLDPPIALDDPEFYSLFPHCWGGHDSNGCVTWHGVAGFRDRIETRPGIFLDLYPNAASLNGICRKMPSYSPYTGTVYLKNDPEDSLDITHLIQAAVDYGRYEPGEYIGIVLENASNMVEIPKGSLAVYVEWMNLFKNP